MVPFAGWEMPVQYTSIIEEHMKVRQSCGIFDVSHMGEIRVSGPAALDFLDGCTPNLVAGQVDGQIRYNALLNQSGGLHDDITVFREKADSYFLVVNASNADKVWQRLEATRPATGVVLENLSDRYALVALQGPLAEDILVEHPALSGIVDQIRSLKYYHFLDTRIDGAFVRISRTGYTGEDGFEVLCENEHSPALWNALMTAGRDRILPAGLGCRDSLRLEAMYPLYGHELGEDRTPVEGGIGWIVKEKTKPYPAMQKILAQKANGPTHRIAPFILDAPGVAREGYAVFINGAAAGTVQSGAFSPVLKKSIGTVFVPLEHTAPGTQIEIEIRDRRLPATIQKGAFVSGSAGRKK